MAQELRNTKDKLQEALNSADILEAVKCLKRINEEGWEVQIDYVPAAHTELSRSSNGSNLTVNRSKERRPAPAAASLPVADGGWLSRNSEDADTKAGSKSVSAEDARGIGQMLLYSFESSNSTVQRELAGELVLEGRAIEYSSDQSLEFDSSRR